MCIRDSSHPGSKDDVTKWVLSKFKPTEKNSIKKAYKIINNMIPVLIDHGIDEFQKEINTN